MDVIKKIEGVSIQLLVDYQPREIDEHDGSVEGIKNHNQVDLLIETKRDDIYGFIVQGQDRVVVGKRNRAKRMTIEGKIFQLTLPIQISRSDSTLCTYSNKNNMNLLQLSPDGRFQMWREALIAQNFFPEDQNFFLTIQETRQGRCYQDNGKIICPPFDTRFGARKNWESMMSFLGKFLVGEDLDPITDYESEAELVFDDLKPNTGRVIFWDFFRNNGAIVLSSGEAVSVYWKEVPPRPRLRYLIPWETVKFEELAPYPQFYNSERHSEFQKTAIGIKPK